MNIKVMLDDGAIMPTRAHEADAGLDLYAPVGGIVPAGEWYPTALSSYGGVEVGSVTIDTGVHVEIPKGYVGFIKSKSGLNVKHGLTADGVIDSGYTGSIRVKLYNHTEKDYRFDRWHKIAQLVILPIVTPDLELVDELESTERGDGGFGSTGK